MTFAALETYFETIALASTVIQGWLYAASWACWFPDGWFGWVELLMFGINSWRSFFLLNIRQDLTHFAGHSRFHIVCCRICYSSSLQPRKGAGSSSMCCSACSHRQPQCTLQWTARPNPLALGAECTIPDAFLRLKYLVQLSTGQFLGWYMSERAADRSCLKPPLDPGYSPNCCSYLHTEKDQTAHGLAVQLAHEWNLTCCWQGKEKCGFPVGQRNAPQQKW